MNWAIITLNWSGEITIEAAGCVEHQGLLYVYGTTTADQTYYYSAVPLTSLSLATSTPQSSN